MKSFRDFKKILDSRPAYNNPKDDAYAGMDDKMKAHWKEKTLYGGDVKSLKKRMHDAHKRNKRQRKIANFSPPKHGWDLRILKTKKR